VSPLPELEIAATGNAGDLVMKLTEVAEDLGVTVRIVEAEEWVYGEAMGVCKYRCIYSFHPVVEAKAQANQANLAVTYLKTKMEMCCLSKPFHKCGR